MAEVEISGFSAICKNIDKSFTRIEGVTKKLLSTDTKRLSRRIYAGLGGSRTQTAHGFYTRSGGGAPGTGLEIQSPRRVSNIINVRTGKMRSSLTTFMSSSQHIVSGNIGWPSVYRANNAGAVAAHSIDWPNKRLRVGLVRGLSPGKLGAASIGGRSPTKYVGEVLLGTDKVVGRNVLRMALVDDIRNKKTEKHLASSLKKLIKRIK